MECFPRQSRRRLLYALSAAFIFVFLFTQFHIRAGPGQARRPWTYGTRSLTDDIYNTTLGFEKIFVISLPSRTDRRDGMALQAALSNFEFEFIDGVPGENVPDKAIPAKKKDRASNGVIGCWRGHMNAMREIIQRNLTSALILEDDADWDIRIKQQLHDFALSTQALIQPLAARPNSYADPTYPSPPTNMDPPSELTPPELDFHHLPTTLPATLSPYGDNWDILWLGHCGMHFPFPDTPIPKGRVIRLHDTTVAPKRHLWGFTVPFTLKETYPEHTRAVHHVQEGVCTQAYAVSQRGARRLLYEVGLKDVTEGYDILLRFFCEGVQGREEGRQCLTTQPGLFQSHTPVGKPGSDIGAADGEFRERAMTDMVRWSVRLNAAVLMEGRVEDVVDQYPDEEYLGGG